MGNEMKKIIEAQGKAILETPDALETSMRESGCSEREIHSVLLILKCCPSVTEALGQEELSASEAEVLVRTVVLRTGLSADATRNTLGTLLRACGQKTSWGPRPAIRDGLTPVRSVPVSTEEVENIESLLARIEEDPNSAAVYSDLNNLAREGNVQAAYALGSYFKKADNRLGTEAGLPYFKTAAAMGYGPANGAIADYILRRKHKNMGKIAANLKVPTVFCGKDGREWADISERMLVYRQENLNRLNRALWFQLAMLLFTIAVAQLGSSGWGTAAILAQGACFLWILISRLCRPYASARIAIGATALSWLVLVLAVL